MIKTTRKTSKPTTRRKPTVKKEKALDKMTKPELLHIIAELKSQLQSSKDLGANQQRTNDKNSVRLAYLQECVDQISAYDRLPFHKKFFSKTLKKINRTNVAALSTDVKKA